MKRKLILALIVPVALVTLGGPPIASGAFRREVAAHGNPAALPAQPGATGYEVAWWTVYGGGGTSTNNGYSLTGTMGQPGAGAQGNTGYALLGGYWGGVSGPLAHLIQLFIPLIRK